MAEKTIADLLSIDVDSQETKFLETTNIYSFKTLGPNGEIIFDSTQQTIPGFIADSASLAFTASTAPAYLPLAGGTITGDLTVNGTAYLNSVVSVTSSYSSGSTIFGDTLSDTHRFTGSVFITGSSFTWNNSTIITSDVTSSISVTSASYAATASKIIIVNEATSPATYYPIFANSTSGPVSLGADASTYTYQPSTNILTVTSSLALDISASSINSTNRQLIDAGGVASVQWNSYRLYNSSNNLVVHWGTGNLYSGSFVTSSVSWNDRVLRDSDGTVTVDWENAVLNDPSGNTSVNVSPRRLHDSSTNVSIAWEDRNLLNSATTVVTDWENHLLYDDSGLTSIDWKRRRLLDPSENISVDYENRQLYANDGATIALDWANAEYTNINNALALTPLDPLPTGFTGMLAVSGSSLYFHNGSSWQLII
jgi:hypothetical protein